MRDQALNQLAATAGGMSIQASFDPQHYAMWTVQVLPAGASKGGQAIRGTLSEALDAAIAELAQAP